MLSVLLADDHQMFRAGLRALLEAESDIEVVGEAANGAECLRMVKALRPDLVLLDIHMPEMSGLAALSTIVSEVPGTAVVMLTMVDDVAYLRRVLAEGGSGYLLKDAAPYELMSAIHTVADGGVFLRPEHARLLASEAGEDAVLESESERRFATLSDREAEVFRLLAFGHTNSEVADQMFLSVKTVETYRSRMMQKLKVGSRAALVRTAIDLGILNGD